MMPGGQVLKGSCACRAVRFVTRGGPVHVAFCHCGDCRRASGAPASVWAGFHSDAVELEGPLVHRQTTESVSRGFCAECGGALTYVDAAIPQRETYIAVGAFDRAGELAPAAHAYWQERLHWVSIVDDLPKFAGTSRRREGAPEPQPLA